MKSSKKTGPRLEAQRQEIAVRTMLSELKFEIEKLQYRVAAIDCVADLIVSKAGVKYVVESKALLHQHRLQELEGVVARGILQLGFLAKHSRKRPMLVVCLVSLSSRTLNHIRAYIERHAPDLTWVIADQSGNFAANIGGKPQAGQLKRKQQQPLPTPRPITKSAFTAKSEHLLKNLLLPGIDRRYFQGPAEQPKTVQELSKLIRPSSATYNFDPYTSNLVTRLEPLGVRFSRGNGFYFKDLPVLLARWIDYKKLAASERNFSAIPRNPRGKKAFEFLSKKLPQAEGRAILAYEHAAQSLGFGAAGAKCKIRLYVDRMDSALLEILDLEITDSPEAPIRLIEPHATDSVFRHSVGSQSSIVRSDVLQTYLDLKSEDEQDLSSRIYSKILEPHFATLIEMSGNVLDVGR